MSNKPELTRTDLWHIREALLIVSKMKDKSQKFKEIFKRIDDWFKNNLPDLTD